MDDDTELGDSLAANLDHSPDTSSNMSKSDVMSGNRIIDNWCKYYLKIFLNIKLLLSYYVLMIILKFPGVIIFL